MKTTTLVLLALSLAASACSHQPKGPIVSETTPFASDRPFPFCLTDDVPSEYDYVGGLTLAEVMNVWWNLESLEISSAGAFDAGGGAESNVNISVIAPTDALVETIASQSLADTGFASTARAPVNRVCIDTNLVFNFLVNTTDSDGNDLSVYFSMLIIKDPDDSSKYAVAYRLQIRSVGPMDTGCIIANPSGNPYISGSPEFTGLTDFYGIGLPWVGGPYLLLTIDGDWTMGGTGFGLTLTPSFFTYPAP